MKYFKYIGLAILILLAVAGLLSLSSLWHRWQTSTTEVTADVLLERIEKVIKLTAVEGNFSEIYNYKHHLLADVWPMRKKALVRVKARVAVGYDFEQLVIDVNEEKKVITIRNFPEPKILSIEHDMDYYNFENGLFNMITNKDITQMGIEAKQFIALKAQESDLFAKAEEQKNELLQMLSLTMQPSGWRLDYPPPKLKD